MKKYILLILVISTIFMAGCSLPKLVNPPCILKDLGVVTNIVFLNEEWNTYPTYLVTTNDGIAYVVPYYPDTFHTGQYMSVVVGDLNNLCRTRYQFRDIP